MNRNISNYIITVLLALGLVIIGACQKSTEEKAPQPAETAISAADSSVEAQPPETPSGEKTALATDAQTAQPAAEVASAELMPIDIKLPKPVFVGTPTNMQVPNLEKPLGHPRPAFLAPAGIKNIAFKKPVKSSDEEPVIGEIAMITDGNKEATEGSYVELGPFLQQVTIDLGARHNIYAIVLWHFHNQPRVYFDIIVQAADDPDFTTNVKTLFNNDIDNSAGKGVGKDMHYVETAEGKLIDAKGVQSRYIRFFSNGNNANDLNHYIEVEVYGKPM